MFGMVVELLLGVHSSHVSVCFLPTSCDATLWGKQVLAHVAEFLTFP